MPDLPSPVAPHPFDDALALDRRADGVFLGQTSEAWWNFIGPFGGLVAALLLRAVLDDPRRRGTPVALTANFTGAIARGAFELEPVLVRGGRTTQHWTVGLRQGDAVLATATVVCAQRGHTWGLQPATMPEVPPAADVEPFDLGGGVRWTGNYRFRFVAGAPAFSLTPHDPPRNARSLVWLEDMQPRPLDWLSLAALSDAFFPRVMHARGIPVRLGTVTMTTYFHADDDALAALGTCPVLGVADGDRFGSSFQDQRIQLWAPDGQLLVTGGQLLWYEA